MKDWSGSNGFGGLDEEVDKGSAVAKLGPGGGRFVLILTVPGQEQGAGRRGFRPAPP